MKIIALAAALACLSLSPAWADPPPVAAPPYRPGVSLQPVAIYDALGNIVSPSAGSVAAPGTSGSQAQAVQGINGGVPVAVSAAALPLPAGAATSAAQSTGNASLASIDGKAPALVSGRVPVDGSAVTQPVTTQRATLFTDAPNVASPANGSFVGTVRDLGAAPAYTKMVAALYASSSGTFFIQACVDSACGVNYTVALQQVTTTFTTITAPVVTRYMRVQWVNNATAGTIGINSSFLAN